MIQGDKDTEIPVHHAYYIKERAEELGAPVDILIVKNAGHNFRRMDTGKMNTIITTRTGSIITAAGTYTYIPVKNTTNGFNNLLSIFVL